MYERQKDKTYSLYRSPLNNLNPDQKRREKEWQVPTYMERSEKF